MLGIALLAQLFADGAATRGTSDKPPSAAALRLSRSVGRLVLSTASDQHQYQCTAVVISPTHIVTAAHCIFGGVDKAALILGATPNTSQDALEKSYAVKLPPVDFNKEVDFAVLEVEGNPVLDFGVTRLLVRDPIPQEEVLLIYYGISVDNLDKHFQISVNCHIAETAARKIIHNCRSGRGASGAMLFSAKDEAVVGIEARAGRHEGLSEAIPMRDIVAASKLIGSVAWVEASPPVVEEGQVKRFTLNDDAFATIKVGSPLKINGTEYKVSKVEPEGQRVTLIGDGSALKPGRGFLENLRKRFQFWNEEQVLSAFEEPYKRTFAIIAAIDDYDRSADPQRRGKTRFCPLTDMRLRAEELPHALIDVGFPNENIQTFYDGRATSTNIAEALSQFWEGERFADADRLFFYFGGHGAGDPGRGYLVTYDIDRSRPTRTGFLMSEFASRHFPNIKAHHVLVALDSCASGLAVPGMQTLSADTAVDRDNLKRFATLATIRSQTKSKASNLLLAGTGQQSALWENGSIFTRSLVQALRGEADYTNDGVVQVDELALFLNNRVTTAAAASGILQDPRSFTADLFGSGKVLFMLPKPD